MRRKYDSMLPSGDSQMQGGNSETGGRQESPRKQEKPIEDERDSVFYEK